MATLNEEFILKKQNVNKHELSNLTMLKFNFNHLTSIDIDSFDSLTNLRHLSLNKNELKSIDPRTFASLVNLRILSLYDNQLESIHSDTLQSLFNLNELYLGRNKLMQINPQTFRSLANLKVLNFSENKLKLLDANTFEQTINLCTLVLASNQLESIQPNTFNGLKQLTELDLSNNNLTQIDARTFDGLENLKVLHLNNNYIKSLDENTFVSLTNLTTLSLEDNEVLHLYQFMFKGLKKLKKLYLRNNKFNENKLELFLEPNVEHISFKKSVNSQYGDNNIKDVGWRLTKESLNILYPNQPELVQMEEIDLSNKSKFNGGIFAVDENVFEELKYLKKLNLADNQIETIDSNIFDHFIDFKELNLSNNKLKPINGKFFEDLGDVQTVSFFNNPEQMDPFVLFKEIFDKSSLNIQPLNKCTNVYTNYLVHNQFIDCAKEKARNREPDGQTDPNSIVMLDANVNNQPTVIDMIIQDKDYTNIVLKEIFELYETEKKRLEGDEKLNSNILINELKTYKALIDRDDIYILNQMLENVDYESLISVSNASKRSTINFESLKELFFYAIQVNKSKILNFLLEFTKNLLDRYFLDCKQMNINQKEIEKIFKKIFQNDMKLNWLFYETYKMEWWETISLILDLIKFLTEDGEKKYFFDALESFDIANKSELLFGQQETELEMRIFPRKSILQTGETALKASEVNEVVRSRSESMQSPDSAPLPNGIKSHIVSFAQIIQAPILKPVQNANLKLNSSAQRCSIAENFENPFHNKIYPLYLLSESRQKQLLRHHTTQKFLQTKWESLGRYVYNFMLFFYLFFLICYSINSEIVFGQIEFSHSVKLTFSILAFICPGVSLLLEMLQLTLEGFKFFHSWKNITEILNYSFCIVAIWMSEDNVKLKSGFYSITLVLSFLLFIMKLEKVKRWDIGLYVYAFKNIFRKSIRLTFIVLVLITGFLLTFRVQSSPKLADSTNIIQLNNSNAFFPIDLLRFSIQFASNIDHVEEYQITYENLANYLVTFLFMFVMHMFLFNLFVGIAIEELADVLLDGEIKLTRLRIEYVIRVQHFKETLNSKYLKSPFSLNNFSLKRKLKEMKQFNLKYFINETKFVCFKLFGIFYLQFESKKPRETTIEDIKDLIINSEKSIQKEIEIIKEELKTIKSKVLNNASFIDELNSDLQSRIRDLREQTRSEFKKCLNDYFDHLKLELEFLTKRLEIDWKNK